MTPARAWAARVGVRVDARRNPHDQTWDGRVIAARGMNDSDLCHEIAHWLVASEERRRLPEFGLGSSPYGALADRVTTTADNEESLASMLGILAERALGLEWWETWIEHGWGGARNQWVGARDGMPVIRELRRRGLVDSRLRPRGWE